MNTYQYTEVNGLNQRDRIVAGIHGSVVIGKNLVIGQHVLIEEGVTIGDNCFIGPHCLIRHGGIMGNNVSIRSFCLLDPEVMLGNDIAVYPHATIGGGTIIEDKVYYGPYTLTTNCDKIRHHRTVLTEEIIKPPLIKKGAIIAAGCMIKPGIIIGSNSVIGLGSVLTKNVPDNQIWFGNPAVHHGDVRREDRIIGEDAIWPYSIRDYEEENRYE